MVECNWAGNVAYSCVSIRRPETLAELQEIVARAPHVRVVGTRHAFNDIADCETLVSLEALPEEMVIDPDGATVTLNPAITYGRLASALHERGLALHNLASLPHISVAGAIATATHGSGDRFGNLATAVTELDVLRSDGAIAHIDRAHRDFHGAVVNLGSLGVVVRLVLAVEPAYDVEQRVYADLAWDALYDNFDAVTAAGESVSLFTTYAQPQIEQVWVKRRVADAAQQAPSSLFGAHQSAVDVHPIVGLSAENCTTQRGIAGPWWERMPHFKIGFTPSAGDELQSELFVARDDALAAIEVLRGLARELASVLQVSEVRTIAADSLWMSPQYERATVAFHFTWRQDVDQVSRSIARVEEALASFAPRPHWGKLFTIDAATLAERYPRHGDFVDLLDGYDPRRAFRNGWLERCVVG